LPQFNNKLLDWLDWFNALRPHWPNTLEEKLIFLLCWRAD
jgi:hypothetical protein